MQTYSHYILMLVLNQRLKYSQSQFNQSTKLNLSQWPPLQSKSMLLGSVAPDIPLTTLAVAALIADRINHKIDTTKNTDVAYTERLFNTLFFNSRWVKAIHNVFHGPLLTMGYLLTGYWAWHRGKHWGRHLFWFGFACTLHTAIDIPLHHNDGPLLFFPFDWETRLHSPVGYWDPAHYGRSFFLFEHGLMALLLFFVIKDWRTTRVR